MNEGLSIAEMGRRLPGRYRLIRVLSQSPSLVVYLAEEPALTRYVAVTVLAPATAGGSADRARIASEVAAATALGHPHILPAYPGESDGLLYLVSPFVDNPDLGARMSTTGPPPVPATMRILRQVADALDVAHRAGLVHRGVRPGAILVDPGFEHAYLRDFGVAPETVGPDYVVPEQILGGPVDGRADMYALGAVLYQCLTGVAPYLRPDRAAVLAAHVHEGPPRVSERRMDLPRGLDGVIATAMAKNPADRFDSCGAMITAAAAVIGTGGAVPPPPDQASGTRRRRRRWTVVGALVAAVVLIAGGLLVVPRILNRPTSDELARVPAAVRADCAAADADAAVPGAPRPLRCRDVAGQEVLIGLFDSAEAAGAAYRDRTVAATGVATGAGDCADGPGWEHVYPGVGTPVGRVLCGRDASTAGLTWIDNPARTVAVAVRPDGNALELYRSWATWVQVPAFPAPQEQELLALLPDTDCRRAPAGTLEGLDGVVAALDCVPTDAGAGTVTYFRFADAESLRRSYAADVSEAGAQAGVDCLNAATPEFLGDTAWGAVRSGPLGRVLCRPDDGGRPSLTWTADPLLVLARAMGTDPAGLRTFWDSGFRPKLLEMVKVLNERAQPPFPSAEESALLARIPAASSVACLRPSSDAVRDHVGDAAVVAVACGTIRGPDAYYYQYADPAALTAAIGGPARGPDCTTNPPDFRGAAQYTRPDGSTGTLMCGRNDAGNAVLDWTDDAKRIRALAFAVEPATLIAWWQTDAGPI